MTSKTLALVACGRTLPSPGISARSEGELSTDMQNTKHTPGPWKVFAGTMIATDEKGLRQIASVPESSQSTFLDFWETRANANLIAAAPELLEALKDIVEQAEKTKQSIPADLADSIKVLATPAILKAEGGGK